MVLSSGANFSRANQVPPFATSESYSFLIPRPQKILLDMDGPVQLKSDADVVPLMSAKLATDLLNLAT